MTIALFRDDSYQTSCTATVTAVTEKNGIILDQTVFYPTGGGQPGDTGTMVLSNGTSVQIVTTVKGDHPDEIVHVAAENTPLPAVGDQVTLEIDWDKRYRLMRMHSCLHLLTAAMP